MRAAYEGLSVAMKEKIQHLSAYHSYEWSQKKDLDIKILK